MAMRYEGVGYALAVPDVQHDSDVGSADPGFDHDLEVDFAQFEGYADAAVSRQSFGDILGEFLPLAARNNSSATGTLSSHGSSISAHDRQSSSDTIPTSKSIYYLVQEEHIAAASVRGTWASDDVPFQWDRNDHLAGAGSHLVDQTGAPLVPHPAYASKRKPNPKATYMWRYFRSLPQLSTWQRLALCLCGVVHVMSFAWAFSTMWSVNRETIDHRRAHMNFFSCMWIWVVNSGIDGQLRLRRRMEIGVTMGVLILLALSFSAFTWFLSSVEQHNPGIRYGAV